MRLCIWVHMLRCSYVQPLSGADSTGAHMGASASRFDAGVLAVASRSRRSCSVGCAGLCGSRLPLSPRSAHFFRRRPCGRWRASTGSCGCSSATEAAE
jgi:hypothetical protein